MEDADNNILAFSVGFILPNTENFARKPGLNQSFESSVEIEIDHWRDFLKQIVSVVFLVTTGLPFHESDQICNQNGNYLGIVEYDLFLKIILRNMIFVGGYLQRICFPLRRKMIIKKILKLKTK